MLKPTLFINGKITTFNSKKPEVSALAVANGKILASGSDKEILESFSGLHKIIDLKQKRVLPGLIDAHAHFLGIGYAKLNLNLLNTSSKEIIINQVKNQIKNRENDEWIIGRGWDQNDWKDTNFPNHEKLSKISSENPVALIRVDGHALWCNQKALELAKISSQTPDPPGGKILRDHNNNPTGVFIDKAM
ncbi:MAG: amidohydrolase family protein, partial [bacterium]|nr:amidohydrolase family protein [bacterium]